MARTKRATPKKITGSPENITAKRKRQKHLVKIAAKPLSAQDGLYLGRIKVALVIEENTNEYEEGNHCLVYVEPGAEPILATLVVEPVFIKDLIRESLKYTVSIEDSAFVCLDVSIALPLVKKVGPRYVKVMRKLLFSILNIELEPEIDDEILSKKQNMEELYNSVRTKQNEEYKVSLEIDVQHPQLNPTLRPYQKQAVTWMLEREMQTQVTVPETADPTYKKILLPKGTTIFFNIITGEITEEEPLFIENIVTGGILADEMGLGKTVEVLACILCNPRKESESCDESEDRNSSLEDNSVLYKERKNNELYKIKLKRKKELIDCNSTYVNKKQNKLENVEDYVPPTKITISETDATIKSCTRGNKTEGNVRKKISSVKAAALLWYESKLAEVKVNPRHEESLDPGVECLCGEWDDVDTVKCTHCDKIQHKVCLDYDGPEREFCCPQCWKKQNLVETGATLIISPISLSKQWVSEIKKHVKKHHLRVFVYQGLQKTGYIYPTKFKNYDLVLTTYNILQSEVKYTHNDDLTRKMRFTKKYNIPTSPLLCLNWWRVCLDEAQVVDNVATLVAEMAKRISAVHRWAVTGTPAERGLSDLYGLVSFLGLTPYNDRQIWDHVLFIPYYLGDKEPLHTLLSKILWRSTKQLVLDQINIPKQTEIVHWSSFTPVEDFFYKREHELCLEKFNQRLCSFTSLDVPLRSINRHSLKKLLDPFLAIRQACTHHRAVRRRYLSTKKTIMSIDDLLEALIAKHLVESSDTLRAIIAALNGMAGIHMIRDEWNSAAETYRDVLRLIEQHRTELSVDTLPHLHTIHNLAELLEAKYPGANIPPTLRDDQLRKQASELENKYIERHITKLLSAQSDYQDDVKAAMSVAGKFTGELSSWLPKLVNWVGELGLIDELLEKATTALTNHSEKSKLNENLTSGWTLIYLLTTWWDKLISNIESLRSEFKALPEQTDDHRFSNQHVNEVVACHLRPQAEKKKKKCFMCKIEAKMSEYECQIFLMSTRFTKTKRMKLSVDENQTTGTWKASEQEITMKAVFLYGRMKGAGKDLLENGEIHLELCDSLKKEFKTMRRLWTFYGDVIAAQDEISMCKERIRLRLPNEVMKKTHQLLALRNLDYNIENKLEHINVIDGHLVDMQFKILESDKKVETTSLTKKLGTLAYLKTLRKRQYSGMKPDPCPICTNPLEENWSVFSCGHSYCLECIHTVLVKYSTGSMVTCSVCRQEQHINDVSYIQLKTENDTIDKEIETCGSFSTKIESILRCVLSLRKDDNNVKVLIFSSWKKVLNVICEAFTLNKISFLYMKSSNADILEKFKNNPVTALILPVRSGSKGLNIIEATHVMFVEPLMNPGEELQAIGRVHRIGQTKPTFVHRFFIKTTIEESIHNAVSTNNEDWGQDKLTISRIQNIFNSSIPTENSTST